MHGQQNCTLNGTFVGIVIISVTVEVVEVHANGYDRLGHTQTQNTQLNTQHTTQRMGKTKLYFSLLLQYYD